MLIRSQNRGTIVNVDATNHIFIGEVYRPNGSLYDVCADEMRLGYYLTKTTAMKVLDMIQEVYAEYKFTCTFLTGFTGHQTIAESNDVHVNGFKELAEGFKKNMVFQMPEDSEVEA